MTKRKKSISVVNRYPDKLLTIEYCQKRAVCKHTKKLMLTWIEIDEEGTIKRADNGIPRVWVCKDCKFRFTVLGENCGYIGWMTESEAIENDRKLYLQFVEELRVNPEVYK